MSFHLKFPSSLSVCVFSLVRTRPLSSFIQHVLSVFSILSSSLFAFFFTYVSASICHPSLSNKPNYFSISLIRDPLLCFSVQFLLPPLPYFIHSSSYKAFPFSFHFPVISNFYFLPYLFNQSLFYRIIPHV